MGLGAGAAAARFPGRHRLRSGSISIEFLVLLGITGYAASRYSLAGLVCGTTAWTIWTTLSQEALGTAYLGGYLALAAVALAVGLSVRVQAAHRQVDATTIAAFEDNIRTALQQQRDELSRELHDIVAHDLTIIAMQSSAGGILAKDTPTREAFDVIGDSARGALDDLRLLLRIMREPDERQEVGDSPTSIDLVGEMADLATSLEDLGHSVATRFTGDVARIPGTTRTTVQRLLREGVTNVLKHGANPSEVQLELAVSESEVVAAVTNSPLATQPRPAGRRFTTSGYGLIGLRERVSLLGGSLTTGIHEGDAWQVRATLPIAPG